MGSIRLKWKIFLYLLGFCALLLILLWFFQTVFLYDTYKIIREREIESAVSYVKANIDSDNLPAIFDSLLQEKNIFVTNADDFVPPRLPPPDGKSGPRQEAITRTESFALAGGGELSLTFHAIITPVDATVNTLKFQLYAVTLVTLLLSVLLAIIIAKRVSRPLENINKSAKLLSAGNYGVSFSGGGFLEIRELADTLNTAASELSKVEQLRRELMANVSHDLRTPLSLIYSHAEMMHDFPEETSPSQTQVIMDEVKRLSSLVDDMLDLSRLESAGYELRLTQFNLTELVRKTTESIAGLLRQNGYDISFEYAGEYFVLADEPKIAQAYYNFLINAVNYCGGDKRVEVRQSLEDGGVKIEVADHGDGIEACETPYIWERYYKSDKNHRRAVTGSGLGLSIVRKILELHGARYGVRSEPGKGSVFWFSLDVLRQ